MRRAFTTPLLLWAVLAVGSVAAAADRPPNIVFILIDDLGWMDLGCQGSTFYETPNIDRLAGGGMRFTNAYANCPVCSPSRAAFMTGRYPGRVGFTGHITAIGRHRYRPHGRIVPPDDYLYLRHEEITIAEALKPAGYVSASIGKWHLGPESHWSRTQGFDVNVAGYDHGSPPAYFFPYTAPDKEWNPRLLNLEGGEEGEYLTDRLTDEAVRFIKANRERSFFLYLPHYAVHTPLEAPEDLVRKYNRKLERDDSQINATYAAMIEKVDESVGRIVGTLEELGLTGNTLVWLTSDNGGELRATRNMPLRAGKGHVYEGGIRVPLMVKWPGRIAAGAISDLPTTGADVLPTLAAVAGESSLLPETVDGVSLLPELTGEGEVKQHNLFWYYPHYSPQGSSPGAVIRSGDYKLIQLYDPPLVELYNLADDIGETTNLAKSKPALTADLKARLTAWIDASVPTRHTLNPNHDPELASKEQPQ